MIVIPGFLVYISIYQKVNCNVLGTTLFFQILSKVEAFDTFLYTCIFFSFLAESKAPSVSNKPTSNVWLTTKSKSVDNGPKPKSSDDDDDDGDTVEHSATGDSVTEDDDEIDEVDKNLLDSANKYDDDGGDGDDNDDDEVKIRSNKKLSGKRRKPAYTEESSVDEEFEMEAHERSPRKVARVSPVRDKNSANKTANKTADSPRKVANIPRKVPDSPAQRINLPRKVTNSPKKVTSSPRKVETVSSVNNNKKYSFIKLAKISSNKASSPVKATEMSSVKQKKNPKGKSNSSSEQINMEVENGSPKTPSPKKSLSKIQESPVPRISLAKKLAKLRVEHKHKETEELEMDTGKCEVYYNEFIIEI